MFDSFLTVDKFQFFFCTRNPSTDWSIVVFCIILKLTSDFFFLLIQQLSLLPLVEPIIGVSFAHFLPYGSGQLNGGNRLVGSFGSATLDGASDYYSQLIYKV